MRNPTPGQKALQGDGVCLVYCPEFSPFVWPDDDVWVFMHCLKAWYSMENRLMDMRHRRVAVQAGGCMGYVPGRLSTLFEHVVSFELDPDNYRFMKANLEQFPNVQHFNVALGEDGRAGFERFVMNDDTTGKPSGRLNHGMTKVVAGTEIESVSIDSLGLPFCDAIILDAEAHEPVIIAGALITIERCRPELIVCETVTAEMVSWLAGLGYCTGPKYGGDASFHLPDNQMMQAAE